MSDLTYVIQVDYINDSNEKVSVSRTIYDTGLEVNSISVNGICVVEETINGRVLSGSYISKELECGYRYNYDVDTVDEYLVTTNKDLSLNDTVNLINKTKMKQEFLFAKLIFNMLLRKDYKVVTLKSPSLTMTRRASGVDEDCNVYSCEECLTICKNNEFFEEFDRGVTCRINEMVISDDVDEDLFVELKQIIDKNPLTYKSLIDKELSKNR